MQPLPQSHLSMEQQNLQALGMYFNKMVQEFDILERVTNSMKTRLLDFGVALQKLQQDAQNKKAIEQKYVESKEKQQSKQ